MPNKLKHLSSFFILVVFIIIAIASSGIKRITFTVNGGQIPPEFNNFNDTLLVIKADHDFWYNKYLRQNFKSSYTGYYKIIKEEELKSYPKEKYRYVFDHSTNYATKTTIGGPFNGSTKNYASSDVYYVSDRLKNIDYLTTSHSYYSKLMRGYIKALDKARKK